MSVYSDEVEKKGSNVDLPLLLTKEYTDTLQVKQTDRIAGNIERCFYSNVLTAFVTKTISSESARICIL